MRLDQVDVDPAAPGLKEHAQFEQGLDIAPLGIGHTAAEEEVCALL